MATTSEVSAAHEAALAFCEGLTPARHGQAAKLIASIASPRDAVYRHFHHSYKQYGRLQVGILAGLRAMAALMSDDGGDPLPVLEAAGVHPWLLDEAHRALTVRWSPERNDADRWRADWRQLAGAWLQVVEVARASVEAARRMATGEGFLWSEHQTLDEIDALFLEVWQPLGTAFRYAWSDRESMADLEARCRQVLEAHGQVRGRAKTLRPPDG
jgi:hypothetical protein